MQTLNLLTHITRYLVNLVFLFLSMQYIRLTTYYHIFVKQLMTDFCLFQSHLLSQSGNNTVLLILFVIMTGFFPPDILIYLSGLI
jgi:multidrug transporter EmrE-like cation transporter